MYTVVRELAPTSPYAISVISEIDISFFGPMSYAAGHLVLLTFLRKTILVQGRKIHSAVLQSRRQDTDDNGDSGGDGDGVLSVVSTAGNINEKEGMAGVVP